MGKFLSLVFFFGALYFFPLSNDQEAPNLSVLKQKVGKTKKSADPDSLNNDQFFPAIPQQKYDSIFQNNASFAVDGFDFPVGKPDAKNYYKAMTFGQRFHLGEDWNGTGGGNTDLGDPVYSSANGLVVYADNICCGWGNTVRVIHFNPNSIQNKYIETIYSHLHNIYVKVGDLVDRGEQLGTIGTANGKYLAHLHFEMRDFTNMSIGPGYSEDQFGYMNPTEFIQAHRPK